MESRRPLLAYILGRVSDPHLAEDILHESLLKALQAAPDLRDEEKLVPWFHRIVQRAIVDAYRRQARERRGRAAYALDTGTHAGTTAPFEAGRSICLCFRPLLATLNAAYRELIEAIDLQDRDPDEIARHLGITRNNLNVRLFRARRRLRQRLEAVCTACASYVDCACAPTLTR